VEVGLPKQIQAQLEAAEQLEQQLRGAAPTGETPPVQEAPPPAEAPVQEPTQPVATPPVRPAEDSYQAKYETLQGKYTAEVPKLYEAIRERDSQLMELRQRIDALASKPADPPKAEPLVTAQDEDRFGSDLVDFTRRAIQEGMGAIDKRLQQLEQFASTVADRVQRVDTVARDVQESKQEKYWSNINTAVPDWQTINADPRWLTWLGEFDPVAGRTRQAALDDAANALNAQRVVGMFNLFKAAAGLDKPQPKAPDPQAELARQVAPTRSSTTTTTPTGAKTFTGQEYQHWTDPRRIHDTPSAQLKATLDELELALAENRIRW
jgi:hypothetical protein